MKKILLFLVAILILCNTGFAFVKLTNYANDFAGLLSADEEGLLNNKIKEINERYSVEIAIVTLKNTEGDSRINYANRIGEDNGVGKKGKDNGIVVLWSLDNEKGGAIATGRGIESILNDAKVTRIGRASREQYFDKGRYYDAFNFVIDEIAKEIEKANSQGDQIVTASPQQPFNFNRTLLIIAIVVIGLIIAGSMMRGPRSYSSSDEDEKPSRSRNTYVPIIIPTGRSSSSKSSSSSSSRSSSDDNDDYSGRSSSYAGSSYSGGGFSGFGGGSFGGGGGSF